MHVTSTQKDSVMTADYAWNAETVVNKLNPNYIDVCSKLKKVRLIRGYTLEDVEILSEGKFTKEAVGSYERNNRSISLKRLLDLCDFYEVSLSLLIDNILWNHPLMMVSKGKGKHGLRTTA